MEGTIQQKAVTWKTAWGQFVNERLKGTVETAALEYPQTSSIVVDFTQLDAYDARLAEETLQYPEESLKAAREALRDVEVAVDPRPPLSVRVRHLRPTERVEVRQLRHEHLDRLVAVQGVLRKAGPVHGRYREALYRCELCGAFFDVPQDEELLREPDVCPEEKGGCGRKGVFKLLPAASRMVNTMRLTLEELTESMEVPTQPQRLSAYTEVDDVINLQRPIENLGARVVATGIVRQRQVRDRGARKNDFVFVLEVLDLELLDESATAVVITPQDEARIREAVARPTHEADLVASLAPGLYGLDWEKLALWACILGGTPKVVDGQRRRGSIHVLLCGDPSTGKSALLKAAQRVVLRSVYATGEGSSAVGLTAAAAKDEIDGSWGIEAGALPLADQGILFLDELDKLEKEDRDHLHTALEQQTVHVNKAGMNANLNARCGVAAAANPKHGRFDEYATIASQLNLSPPLLSRFDLIFIMRETIDVGRDRRLAAHISALHRQGQQLARRDLGTESQEPPAAVAPYDVAFMRMFVVLAQTRCIPLLTPEAEEELTTFFTDLRSQSRRQELSDAKNGAGAAVPITTRQYEGLLRLSEMFARMHLSDLVTLEHARKAIGLMSEFLKRVAFDLDAGVLDIDLVATGQPRSQQDRMRALYDVLRQLDRVHGDAGVPADAIILEMAKRGHAEERVRLDLAALKERGEVWITRSDTFRPVT